MHGIISLIPYCNLINISLIPCCNLISHCQGVWPNDWIQMNPIVFAEPMPMGNANVADSLKWLNIHQIPIDYSVKDAWQTMDGLHLSVSWPKYVWFKGCVPKHVFCM